jgi:pyroglutamyl-peptidase
MRTILLTGFGPFPGAPHNPTGELIKRLARFRRPGLNLVPHVFPTEYAAIDRDLPRLMAKHRPDALLMFGLHGRARTLRVETVARNALGRHRDASGQYALRRAIVPNTPHRRMATPAARLVRAARRAGVPAVLSRDAGSYLCNYLCWHATAAAPSDVRLAAFVHVPPVARKALRSGQRRLRPAMLERAAKGMIAELAGCLGSAGLRT